MRDLSSWSFMRILRLVAGAFAIVQAFITVDIVLGVLGLIVGGMALLNMDAVVMAHVIPVIKK